MKYAIDQIIDDIAVLENIKTKEKKEVNIKILPPRVKEGNIVIEKNIYTLDKEEEQKRKQSIKEKLDRLKK